MTTKPRFTSMSLDERIKLVMQVVVHVPQDAQVHKHLVRGLSCQTLDGKPNGFSIIGQSRAGKTTVRDKMIEYLIKDGYAPTHNGILPGTRIAKLFPVQKRPILPERFDGKQRFFTAIDAPSSGRPKAFLDALLNALGDVIPARSTIASNEDRILNILNKIGVDVVFVDECHHLVMDIEDTGKWRISEIFKNLQNGSTTLFVFLGIEEFRSLHQQNAQFRHRNPAIIDLKPYDWSSEAGQEEFKRFVYEYCARLPFDRLPMLDGDVMAFRIYQATSGSRGAVVELIRDAAIEAIYRGADTIELVDLDTVYREIYATSREAHVNPFGTSLSSRSEPLPAGYWQRSRSSRRK